MEKIIDGVLVLKEFDATSIIQPAADYIYFYAQDNGSGTTILKYLDSAGVEKLVGSGGGGGGLPVGTSAGTVAAGNDSRIVNAISNSTLQNALSLRDIDIGNKVPLTSVGVANGVATLGANGLIPLSQYATAINGGTFGDAYPADAISGGSF